MATLPAPGIVQERTRLYPAAALALIVEVLLLGGAFVLLSHKPPPVQPPQTLLALALVAPTPAPKPVAAPPQPKPKPVVPRPVVHVHPVVHVVPRRPAVVHTRPVPTPLPAPITPSATPTELPAAPRPPAPAPAPTPVAAAPDHSFDSALRAAIQAALRYPESARLAGMAGRTRVAFQYRDGAVSGARVVVSSGIGLLDRAALAAVRDAAYPRPEPAFAGKTLSEQLWVTFNLEDHD